MERDEKGRFLPGNKEGQKIGADGGLTAAEMQLRGTATKNHNRTIAEMLRAELAKSGGEGLTRGEVLVAKAAHNHLKGKLTFKDLKDIQDLLGESVQNINVTQEAIIKVVHTEEQRRALESMKDLDI